MTLLGVGLLLGLAWYLVNHQGKEGAGQAGGRRSPPPTTVGIAQVARADLPVIIEALGTVNASAAATVRPQVSGVLKEILFSEGQPVKAGQTLAVIDPRQFEATLMQATGQRQRDEAQLSNARQMLDRFQTLLAQDSIARQEVDTQAALVKQLEGTVAADKAAETTAKLNLGYSRIVAPISGRAGLRNVDLGNVVSPNDTNGITVITQTTPIDVQFALPQDRIPELTARLSGMADGTSLPVTALDQGRQNTLDTGRFLALDNQVDPQTGTVRAKARFDNSRGALYPSQFVNVQLLLRMEPGALVVPVNAVRHGANGDYVYVVDPAQRTAMLRNVKRGLATADKVQILSGLQAGEQVVTEGADRLKDGAKVNLPGERPGAGAPGGQGGNRRNAGSGQRRPTPAGTP
ncbi:efflux RND transporter periplasmic adaptor subunit [Noviherbaspirillum sp. 17J57-3]|uniref:Efflux RND transporter periplasmic adaptor subunit n=2 Tax=Noviherbaspirillum galbum TaxID=2709383 RepID=A0A6B3SNY7_9BURK|nr:efflux RND transporter periplasmic adaptor subunit [Noviherbaspirillum galbum]NEX62218.1 efflux RND transporter periplasmic adaptor subunit [Noviherbaspirillum galbum]